MAGIKYLLQKSKDGTHDSLYGSICLSNGDKVNSTLCNKNVDDKWYILEHTEDDDSILGKITCKKCKEILKNEGI